MSTSRAQILVSKDYSPIKGTKTPGKMVGSRSRAGNTRWVCRILCGLLLLLLLLSHFSRVRLCATPSLGFSRQEPWSGLPFPSPMHESEKWKWSRSVMSDSLQPHGLQPTRLLHPWDFPGKSTGVGCHCLLRVWPKEALKKLRSQLENTPLV